MRSLVEVRRRGGRVQDQAETELARAAAADERLVPARRREEPAARRVRQVHRHALERAWPAGPRLPVRPEGGRPDVLRL